MIGKTTGMRVGTLVLGLALGLGLAGSSACRVINPDHCANQAMPGNQWCATLSSTLEYCSPCIAEFHGCVATEPIACPDYAGDDGGDTGGTEGATSMGMMTTVGTLTAGSGGMTTAGMDTMGNDTTMGGGMDTAVEDTAMEDTAAEAGESSGETTTGGGETAMGTSSGGGASESTSG